MLRRTFISLVASAGTSLAAANLAFAQSDSAVATPAAEGNDMTQTAPRTGYAPVYGLQMYYEIHGEGNPLVLLHGAFAAIDMWGPILESLAADHQVIAVEFQGHGHTADIDRDFSYEAFADDVAGLMEHLDIAHADVVGYSLGSAIGLRLAMDRPELVRKLVAISAWYRLDGYYPEVLAGIQEITPEVFAGSPPEEAYLRTAPNPEDWPRLIERIKTLEAKDFAWPEDDVSAIAAPVQLIYGDSDVVRPEHAVALFRLLGGGVPGDLTGLPRSQLAILPGTTHVTLVSEPTDLMRAMIASFLAAPMPEAG
jgi:pimeloyl-ACP methyl ester carboxylesterase